VEAGQLLFVFAIVIGQRGMIALFNVPASPARLAAGYFIGVTSTIWLISRVSSF
jgi:hypothetical protein